LPVYEAQPVPRKTRARAQTASVFERSTQRPICLSLRTYSTRLPGILVSTKTTNHGPFCRGGDAVSIRLGVRGICLIDVAHGFVVRCGRAFLAAPAGIPYKQLPLCSIHGSEALGFELSCKIMPQPLSRSCALCSPPVACERIHCQGGLACSNVSGLFVERESSNHHGVRTLVDSNRVLSVLLGAQCKLQPLNLLEIAAHQVEQNHGFCAIHLAGRGTSPIGKSCDLAPAKLFASFHQPYKAADPVHFLAMGCTELLERAVSSSDA
jgi:hypothetical protein